MADRKCCKHLISFISQVRLILRYMLYTISQYSLAYLSSSCPPFYWLSSFSVPFFFFPTLLPVFLEIASYICYLKHNFCVRFGSLGTQIKTIIIFNIMTTIIIALFHILGYCYMDLNLSFIIPLIF